MIPYEIVRSKRKTMSLQVTREGEVVVRCPLRVSDAAASAFVESHRDWIESHYRQVQERIRNRPVFTEDEVAAFRKKAREILTKKVAYWAGKMDVTYGKITIRQQATRWGSCSARGNLNFNWMLILVPEELQDYVVVHELAHRREMNHSPRFWKIVEAQLPDYLQRRRRLRMYGTQVEMKSGQETGKDGRKS